MAKLILKIYRWLFARRVFYRLNKLLYQCSLRGLGILNFESDIVSGERLFLTNFLKGLPEGAYVIDVGANIGDYSRTIVDIDPALIVYAFKPHPKTFERLSQNIKGANFSP